MSEYTPTPWHTAGDGSIIYDSLGWAVANAAVFHGRPQATPVANARRIVACVNACAGISLQYMEEMGQETLADRHMSMMKDRDDFHLLALRRKNILDAVCKQRDELLGVLERILRSDGAEGSKCFNARLLYDARHDAFAIIDSVKGRQSHGQPEKQPETSAPAIVFFPAGSLGEEVET